MAQANNDIENNTCDSGDIPQLLLSFSQLLPELWKYCVTPHLHLSCFDIGFHNMHWLLDHVKSKYACYYGAVAGGHIKLAKKLFLQIDSIHEKREVLNLPCTNGEIDLVKWLIPHLKSDCVTAPELFCVWNNGQSQLVDLMLDQGANEVSAAFDCACGICQNTHVHPVDECKHLELIQYLYDKTERSREIVDMGLQTAISNNNLFIVKYLVERVYPTLTDNLQLSDFLETPLNLARTNGHTEITEYLLHIKEKIPNIHS